MLWKHRLKFRTISNAINKQMNEETRFLIRKHEYDCELFTKLELAMENGDVVEITGSRDRQDRLPNYVFT